MAIRHYLVSAAFPHNDSLSLGMSTLSIKSGRELTSVDIVKLRDKFAESRGAEKEHVVILNIIKLRR